MNINLLIILALLLNGCSSTILDYDSEKLELEQINKIAKKQKFDPFDAPKSPPHVKVIDEDDVYLEAHKDFSIKGAKGISLEVWHIMATNNNDTSKCVNVTWALQDFEYESSLPSEFLIKGNSKLIVGKLRQTIWAFDGAIIAIPPSAYAKSLSVRDADENKKTGKKSCEPDESNIDNI